MNIHLDAREEPFSFVPNSDNFFATGIPVCTSTSEAMACIGWLMVAQI